MNTRCFPFRFAFVPALLALLFSACPAKADIVTILPIQVGNGMGGFGNASQELYLEATNKIWSQAGLTFNYLPFTSIISSEFFVLDNQAEVDALFASAPGASMASTTISMWFVSDHFDAYGEVNGIGGLASNRIVIADSVFIEGRLDTIAHEVGHLLGLEHDDPGVETNFLMRSGDDRLTPTTIADIFPDGAGLDRLTSSQISTALADAKVTAVPEPSSLILIAGTAGVAFLRRRRVLQKC